MEAERDWGKGRRRPKPRERSSLLSFYFQHGGGEGLGEGQEEANTQGEVVRQKEYLERTLVSLKNQLSQERRKLSKNS